MTGSAPLPPPQAAPNSRAVAARVLARWMRTGAFPDRQVDAVERDRAFVMEMVYAAVRRRETLDWMIRQIAPRSPPVEVRALLHIGLVQLYFMDRVEAFAAVHETVDAARQTGVGWAARMVNAVLREAQRRRNDLLMWLRRTPPTVRLSHPLELLERWESEYGQTRAHRLCEWNNEPAAVCLRLRPGAPSADDYARRLSAIGVEAHPHPFAPSRFLRLGRGAHPPALPGFAEGWFYVQDPSTCIAPDMLAPAPGETVLDACAAPGGKTTILYESMEGRGALLACDHRADRLERLRENLARTGCHAIRVIEADADRLDAAGLAAMDPPAPAAFDAVLLDVPCTNTGVLRRRPDARWAFGRERLAALVRAQASLLRRVADLVRPGGRLVYSTCSLEREENQEQTRAFLKDRPDFRLKAERLLFPPDSHTDGAYAALLLREAALPSSPPRRALPVARRVLPRAGSKRAKEDA